MIDILHIQILPYDDANGTLLICKTVVSNSPYGNGEYKAFDLVAIGYNIQILFISVFFLLLDMDVEDMDMEDMDMDVEDMVEKVVVDGFLPLFDYYFFF